MDEKIKIIIGLLIKKSRAKEVSWVRMDEYAYSIDFNDNRIIINNYFTSFREKRKINLLIVNKRDEVIKSISEDADRSLRELFKLANDNYYNIDLAMDTIIQALSV